MPLYSSFNQKGIFSTPNIVIKDSGKKELPSQNQSHNKGTGSPAINKLNRSFNNGKEKVDGNTNIVDLVGEAAQLLKT